MSGRRIALMNVFGVRVGRGPYWLSFLTLSAINVLTLILTGLSWLFLAVIDQPARLAVGLRRPRGGHRPLRMVGPARVHSLPGIDRFRMAWNRTQLGRGTGAFTVRTVRSVHQQSGVVAVCHRMSRIVGNRRRHLHDWDAAVVVSDSDIGRRSWHNSVDLLRNLERGLGINRWRPVLNWAANQCTQGIRE